MCCKPLERREARLALLALVVEQIAPVLRVENEGVVGPGGVVVARWRYGYCQRSATQHGGVNG